MTNIAVRGTGRTTEQMLALAQGSVFIWCNNKLDFPNSLKHRLNRPDIVVVGPEWVMNERWRGLFFVDVVCDHAVDDYLHRNDRSLFYILIRHINTRIRK